jgi:hypothetical protein
MTTRKTMETKREALGDDEAARELAEDIAAMPQEPEPEEYDDDDQEPDGRWVFTEAGCWLYE